MPNFLENLSEYNAKAAAAIAQSVADDNGDKANMLSGLKATANDITLTDDIRLNALTAMINLGGLLDIPLPPYFPTITTYANTQTFVGVHNDLEGLQGGAPGEYYHLTDAERTAILNKASLGDISWANLSGSYSDNLLFAPLFDAKQNALNGVGLVRINGNQSTITYDNSPYITTISGIAAGGELTGLYPNPILSNAAVIGKVLTGFNPNASQGVISDSDTILTALQKLNANINNVITNPSGVSTVALTNNAPLVFTTTSSPQSGPVSLSIALNTQNPNLVFASPNGVSGLPGFRELQSTDLPDSGVIAATYGSNTVIPQIQVDSKGRITNIVSVTAASGGQVNSISLSVPAFLSPSNVNNTFPSTPDIQIQLDTQAANFVFAGPESGGDTQPDFRKLVIADLPPNIPIENIDGLQTALDAKLSDGLGASLIFMGNGSNKAVQTVVAGDLSATYSVVNATNTGTFTIENEAVTYAKFQNIPDSVLTTQRPILLGRFDAGQGVMQQMTLSGDFTINTTTGQIGLLSPNPPSLVDVGDLLTSTGSNNLVRLSLPFPNDGYLLMPYAAATTPACGLIWGEVGGDISYTVDDTTTPGTPFGAFSIGANKVTLDKIEQIGLNTILGNNTANPDNVAALTATEVTAMLDFFDTATTIKGLVPGSDGRANTYYLDATGNWSEPSGSGGTTTFPLTINNSGTGAASSATFNGSVGVTISSNTILPSFTGNNGLYLRLNSLTGLPEWASAGSGSGTVSSGSQYQLAYYAGAGTTTTVSGLASIGINLALVSDSNGLPVASTVTTTQLQYLSSASGAVSFGGGGTVAYVNAANSWASGIKQTFNPSATTSGINVGSLSGQPSLPVNGDLVYNTSVNALQAYIAGAWVSLGSGGGGGVTSFQTSLSGLTPSTATTGAVTLAGTLGVASGGTGATTLTGLLRGNGTAAITGGATVALGSEVSGTLLVANGGTGITTNTAYAVLLGGTSNGGALTQVSGLGNSGEVLTSQGAGQAPIWAAGGGTVTLNNVLAASASSVGGGILNALSTITWNWNSNTTTNAFVLNSTNITTGSLFSVTHSTSSFTGTGIASFTSTGIQSGTLLNLGISGATATSAKNLVITNSSTTNSSGRGLDISISNTTANAVTFGAVISNTKTATGSGVNTALQLTASGGTTNYALDVTAGVVRLPATSATVPHILFQPGAAALTATTNGMLSYATESSNSSFYLYKDTGVTKLITLDRNPDFALVGTPGVIVSDASGTLSKNADLTALGVLATYSTYTVPTTATNIFSTVSLVGSTILPANFFGVGKTIVVFLSGQYTSGGGPSTIPLTLAFGTTYSQPFTVAVHSSVAAASYWEARITITCSVSGSSGTLRTMATAIANDSGSGGTAKLTQLTLQLASSFNTTIANTISLNANYAGATTAATIDMCQIYYLN